MNRAALVGVGTVGLSWAAVFLRAGWQVTVFDQRPEARQAFPDRLQALIEAGDLPDDLDADRALVCATLEEAVDGVAYVQESIQERLDGKQALFRALDAATGPDVVLGSSTSALPMTEIAGGLFHPERCLVAHPTNPPHLIPLVELVPGRRTDARVLDQAVDLMREVGQIPIVCRREVPGFVLNRLQAAVMREALHLARTGVADPAHIDLCVTEALALRWVFLGPLALEETQGPSLETVIADMAEYFSGMFAEVSGPRGPFDEVDADVMRKAVASVAAGRSHDQLVDARNRVVAAVRGIKAELDSEASPEPA